MEPKSSAAGYALHTIMAKMPTRWEPAIGIVRATHPQQLARLLAEDRRALGDTCRRAVRSRASPRRPRSLFRRAARRPTAKLSARSTSAASRAALEEAVAQRRIQRRNVRVRVSRSSISWSRPRSPPPNFRTGARCCRQTSSWWFLVDRYFAHDPLLTTGFVTTQRADRSQRRSRC